MDGSEDNQLFDMNSDDEDPFEGFISTDVNVAEQYQENVELDRPENSDNDNMELDGNEYSDNAPESDEFEDEEEDPGSPGH